LVVSGTTTLNLHNASSSPETIVIEDLAIKPALTPAMVFQHPDFRDWFSEEVLATDVKLQLGNQIIMFTDIVGSTQLYNAVGDSRAFVVVREHFRTIFAAVRNSGGAVVKTIGDAVMASFSDAGQALNAAMEIQISLHALREKAPDTVRVRISLHTGRVLAVHLDTGLDYFGATVNYAAKIQHLAGADEIVVSQTMHEALHLSRVSADSVRHETLAIPGLPEKQAVWVFTVNAVNGRSAGHNLQRAR
jgi:class 3 adenylate cyclase